MNKNNFNKYSIITKILTLYLLFSSLWIFTSDRVITFLTNNPATITKIQTYKGFLYLLITTIVLYFVINNVISKLVTTHNVLLNTDSFYNSLYNNSHLILLLIDPETKQIVDANAGALKFYKYSLDKICSLTMNDINTMTKEEINKEMKKAIAEEKNYFIFKHNISDGTVKTVQVMSAPITINEGKLLFSMIIDITDTIKSKIALSESEEKFKLFSDNIEACIYIKNIKGTYIFANKYISDFYGQCDLTNKNVKDCIIPDEASSIFLYDKKAVEKGQISYEQSFTNYCGEKRTFKILKFSVPNHNNETLIGGINIDVTDYKVAEEKIKKLAYFDLHTGLYNKNYLVEKVNKLIEENNDLIIGILFISIKNIEQTTEFMGADFTNKLSVTISQRISKLLNKNDTIVQYSKNDFIIQLTDPAGTMNISSRSKNLINQMINPYEIDNFKINISTNVGLSIYPNNSDNIEELIKQSSIAMKMSKLKENNSIVFYDKNVEKQLLNQVHLENDLSLALENDSLQLYYQPIIDTKTEKTIKAEALLRWIHPEKGFISPSVFIPIAEKSNLILTIGEWVIKTAFWQVKSWLAAGITPPKISVNLSTKQLEQKDFVPMLKNIIQETNIDTRYIDFEITESLAINNELGTISTLKEIEALGISFSMDDFGTGYSSLSQLKKLPLKTLKIDMSFISDINEDLDNTIIVTTIIAMAQSMGLSVVAEGVETSHQFEFLRNNNCDMIQGYLVSKPLPHDDFEKIINNKYSFHSSFLSILNNIPSIKDTCCLNDELSYKEIIYNSPQAIIQWSKSFKILMWNKGAENIFGWSEDEALDKNLMKNMILKSELIKSMKIVNSIFSGKPIEYTSKNYTKNKKIIVCNWILFPIFNNNGEVKSVITCTTKTKTI
ncbi:EAL domain-containing protein [Clostridium sp. DL1XJH146]